MCFGRFFCGGGGGGGGGVVLSIYVNTGMLGHYRLTFQLCHYTLFVCLCCFMSQVNSYGHGETVSSPNHIIIWGSLNKRLTSTSVNQYFVHILSLVTDNII